MTGKKRKFIALTSLAVGICMFTAAAVANFATASGYAVYKNAILGLMNGVDNYTMQVDTVLYVDDTEYSRVTTNEMYSATGDGNLYSESKYYDIRGAIAYERTEYRQDGIEIQVYKDSKTEDVSVYDSWKYDDPSFYGRLSAGVELEDEETQKMLRFIELLADTLVGDLKNNFVYVAGDEDGKKYAITLDGMQVPELVNAGLSVVFSAVQADSYADGPLLVLGTDPVVRYGTLAFSVDNEGRLTQNDFYVELVGLDEKGKEHTAVLELSLEISDYGTTVPKKADLDNMDIDYRSSEDKPNEDLESADVLY